MIPRKKLIFYIILLLILILIILFVYNHRVKIKRIINPFLLAIVISYLVHPVVEKLEGERISRAKGILIVYIGISLFAAAVIIFIIPGLIENTKQLINALPGIITEYRDLLSSVLTSVRRSRLPDEIKEAMFTEINASMAMAQDYIISYLKKSVSRIAGILDFIINMLLAMIIAYYFIKDSGFFKSTILSLIPKKQRKGILLAGREVHLVLTSFIQGQLLTALIVGTMEVAGLVLLKVKYPIVMGLISGIGNVIPYFGPIIGAIPAVAVALIDSPLKALLTVIMFFIIQQIDNIVITPKIVEGRVGLHPVTTIFAVLVGNEFFGISGMLLAVPAAAVLKVILKRAMEALV
ncbi:MAG: AI-2E family transporter [Clostridiaceae bacterium]|nr:AI-2E family transporter [Clostridiaceae bacterium]